MRKNTSTQKRALCTLKRALLTNLLLHVTAGDGACSLQQPIRTSPYTQQSAIYTLKRALITLKRALFTPRRDLCTLKRALYTHLRLHVTAGDGASSLQQPIRQSRLAVVNVRDNRKIADFPRVDFLVLIVGHGCKKKTSQQSVPN